MTTTMPTRQQIERAAPLDFPDRKPARQELTLTIKARVNGFDVDICFSGQVEQLDAMTKRLRELGAEPTAAPIQPAAPPKGAQKPAQRVEPIYSAGGEACCPVHMRPLSEGAHGLFCSAKAIGDQVADRKGYCGLRFKD